MSMQRIFNYGSTLQAYSLRRILEDLQPSTTVEFVDYRPGNPLIRDSTADISGRGRVSRNLAKLREYSDVETSPRNKLRFFRHKQSYASRYFPLVGITPEHNYDLNLDLQVIGSDEVFNCVQSNTNVGYARDLFAHGSPARQVISYAGSFGNTTLSKIEAAGIAEELSNDLQRFSSVSVRDNNSAVIVEALTGHAPEIHLDPTLVYDLMGLETRIPQGRQHASKYVIVYGYSGRISPDENHAIRQYADRIGARVLAFGGLQSSADEFIDCDPFTLLAYFRDAEAVVTDTFHGTIFSILNEVPFATLVRPSTSYGYGNEEKLGYLLETLHLSERALQTPASLEQLLEMPIDFTGARRRRREELDRTNLYLTQALSRLE
ncbi:MAG: polysaccharide pyruvyl transferase family protein [Leucobacter sp.]